MSEDTKDELIKEEIKDDVYESKKRMASTLGAMAGMGLFDSDYSMYSPCYSSRRTKSRMWVEPKPIAPSEKKKKRKAVEKARRKNR